MTNGDLLADRLRAVIESAVHGLRNALVPAQVALDSDPYGDTWSLPLVQAQLAQAGVAEALAVTARLAGVLEATEAVAGSWRQEPTPAEIAAHAQRYPTGLRIIPDHPSWPAVGLWLHQPAEASSPILRGLAAERVNGKDWWCYAQRFPYEADDPQGRFLPESLPLGPVWATRSTSNPYSSATAWPSGGRWRPVNGEGLPVAWPIGLTEVHP